MSTIPEQLNTMVWEKATTHNAKKKRNPRKTDPKAPKRAKAAKVNKSTDQYVLIPMADVHRAMSIYNRMHDESCHGEEWASWTSYAGIVQIESQWTPAEEYGYYRLKIRDKHAFMRACLHWGWSPQAANNFTKVSTNTSVVGVDMITGASSSTMQP